MHGCSVWPISFCCQEFLVSAENGAVLWVNDVSEKCVCLHHHQQQHHHFAEKLQQLFNALELGLKSSRGNLILWSRSAFCSAVEACLDLLRQWELLSHLRRDALLSLKPLKAKFYKNSQEIRMLCSPTALTYQATVIPWSCGRKDMVHMFYLFFRHPSPIWKLC